MWLGRTNLEGEGREVNMRKGRREGRGGEGRGGEGRGGEGRGGEGRGGRKIEVGGEKLYTFYASYNRV